MDMIGLQIELACREPGCPLCRLRYDAERRYLFNFLWEGVNDGEVRKRLIRSLGYCPDHAWQLQNMEASRWHDGMGTAIIYEDLTNRAWRALQSYRDALPEGTNSRHSMRERFRRWLARLADNWGVPTRPHTQSGSNHRLAGLVPQEQCRVCKIGESSDERYVTWLVRDCTKDPDLRKAYQASGGLCLPHLRQALRLAEEINPAAARFLTDVAIEHTRTLIADLGEYLRKHSHQYRHEPMSEGEKTAWIRAVAWFSGEKQPTDAEATREEQRRRLKIVSERYDERT